MSKKYLIFGVRDANSRGTESCALVVITAVFTTGSILKPLLDGVPHSSGSPFHFQPLQNITCQPLVQIKTSIDSMQRGNMNYYLLIIKKETTYCDLVNERIAPLPFVSHPIFYRLLRSSSTKQGWVFWLRFNGLISVPRWNTEIGVGTKMIWVFSLILPMF